MSKFFYLPNLSSSSVKATEAPWDLSAQLPRPNITEKAAFTTWCHRATTSHAFLSGYEGLSSNVRISDGQGNPAHILHALIIDYDAKVNVNDHIAESLVKPPSHYPPAYVCQTFSGNSRGIWILQEPVVLTPSDIHIKNFLKLINKKIKFRLWLPGFEESTYLNPAKYYELGLPWVPVAPAARIPTEMVHKALFDASIKISFNDDRRFIPMDAIAAEINRRWPGGWEAPFERGSRGRRFWDATAENQTAAVLHPDGFLCFSGPKPFVTWRDLLGGDWVEKFEADVVSQVRQYTVYDNTTSTFWLKSEVSDTWTKYTTQEFALHLRCHGFESKRERGATYSQIDKVQNDLMMNCVVEGARPFLFYPPGPMMVQGHRVLNTCTAKPMTPAPEGTGTFDRFPLIKKFLTSFMPDRASLEYLLSWIKLFYESGITMQPRPGQVLILQGLEGRGKTLFAEHILGHLMGGATDASSWLVEQSQWTAKHLESPILLLDDAVGGTDPRVTARLSAMLKKLAANRQHTYNAKYRGVGDVWWSGRTIVAINSDAESGNIMPNIEASSYTKFSFLRIGNDYISFKGSRKMVGDRFIAELPYFARYLLDYKIPEHLINTRDNRYVLKPFHHQVLFQESLQIGPAQVTLEMLEEWGAAYEKEKPHTPVWEGTAVGLYRMLRVTLGLEDLIRKLTPRVLVVHLRMLAARGYPITQQMAYGVTKWSINHKMIRKMGAATHESTTPTKEKSANAWTTNQELDSIPCAASAGPIEVVGRPDNQCGDPEEVDITITPYQEEVA